MIPVIKRRKLKGIIKANYRLALELAIQKEVISAQNSQAVKNGAALKSLGEKSCEIKGGN